MGACFHLEGGSQVGGQAAHAHRPTNTPNQPRAPAAGCVPGATAASHRWCRKNPERRTLSAPHPGWPRQHLIGARAEAEGPVAPQQVCAGSVKFRGQPTNPRVRLTANVEHCTAQHSATQHSTALHSRVELSKARHSTALHSTAQPAPVSESKQPPSQSCSRPRTRVPPDGSRLPWPLMTDHTWQEGRRRGGEQGRGRGRGHSSKADPAEGCSQGRGLVSMCRQACTSALPGMPFGIPLPAAGCA